MHLFLSQIQHDTLHVTFKRFKNFDWVYSDQIQFAEVVIKKG